MVQAADVVAVLFTDVVGSTRLLARLGDDAADAVRRSHFAVLRDAIANHRGRELKSLGDGLMVAFADPAAALAAVVEARRRLGRLQVDGWTPRMRAGLHSGRPRRVGGDYLGVAVNTAARLGDAGKADEILVSGDLLRRLDATTVSARRRRRLRLKGAPDDLEVYAVEPA